VIYPHRQPTHTPSPTLNAIAAKTLETDPAHETAEQRTTRHLRICQELIERGMRLARIAADKAEQDMEAPPFAPMPHSAAAAIEQAEARARLRAPNYGIVFARLSRAIRQTIALQAHIAEGRPIPHPTRPPDQTDRRPPSRAATPGKDHAKPRLDAADPPDWAIPTGPAGETDVETLLQTISDSFGTDLPTAPDSRPPQKTRPTTRRPHCPDPPPQTDAPRPPNRLW
jgi:hypothetical protein